jgi:hypothetical protein
MQAADPVRIGLVDSVNRPGGNVTGINLMAAEMAGKRLEDGILTPQTSTLIGAPGRLRLVTRPIATGSVPTVNTMGIVAV